MTLTGGGTHMNTKRFTAANAEIIAACFYVSVRLSINLDRFIAAVRIVAPLIIVVMTYFLVAGV